MSAKNSSTRADYMEWDAMVTLVRRLYRDGDYQMSLLIGCGCFFGLRVSDLLPLTWDQLLDADSITVKEKKTGKNRTIRVNSNFQKHIHDCFLMAKAKREDLCFANHRKGTPITVQWINRKLKMLRVKYHIKIEHFSTHTFRKTMGRHVVEMAGEKSEMALIKLSELFGHSNVAITRIYLGLRQDELMETYELLDF